MIIHWTSGCFPFAYLIDKVLENLAGLGDLFLHSLFNNKSYSYLIMHKYITTMGINSIYFKNAQN